MLSLTRIVRNRLFSVSSIKRSYHFTSGPITTQQKIDEQLQFIREALVSSKDRKEFDELSLKYDVSLPAYVEETVKPEHTLDDYKKWFSNYDNDKPISVYTYETLEWVIDSPPEMHLFEEYPALKIMPSQVGDY